MSSRISIKDVINSLEEKNNFLAELGSIYRLQLGGDISGNAVYQAKADDPHGGVHTVIYGATKRQAFEAIKRYRPADYSISYVKKSS